MGEIELACYARGQRPRSLLRGVMCLGRGVTFAWKPRINSTLEQDVKDGNPWSNLSQLI